MRLIAQFLSKPEAVAFSDFLHFSQISNQCESGSDQFQIWVHNEEDVIHAFELYQQFISHPKHPCIVTKKLEEPKKTASKFFPITYAMLAICCLVFACNMMQERSNKSLINGLTPIQRVLLFDEPKAVENLNGFMGTHGLSSLEEVNAAPVAVQKAFQRVMNIPFWKGFFVLALERLQKQASASNPAPLFEKIQEGQVWRFITPIFMHQDLLHIFFNMAWLLMLGRQIELRLKKSRVLLLILLLAVFSNTSQYLMSGPYFLGFSGVITGLAGFIWARQSKAPWEGYQVQRASLTFLFYFVLILFFISTVCFILNALGWADFNSSMANTAHISGGLLGLILGRCSFFARRLL